MNLNRRALLGWSSLLLSASAFGRHAPPEAAEGRRVAAASGAQTEVSATLAHYVATTRFHMLPAEVVEMTKRAILDAIGVSLAATGLEPACRPFAELAMEMGGAPQSTLIGAGRKAPMAAAALANGALAHALDYEDSHEASRTHPNAATVAAALAAAEGLDVSGQELITAVALGCDIVCRLGLAQIEAPGAAPGRAFYRPAILGTFGAVTAVASLLKLSAPETLDAFSLALCQNSCSGEILNSPDSHIRAVRDGMCAHAGVISALLAKRGVKGFGRPFEGPSGYFAMYWDGTHDDAVLTADLGRRFAGRDVAFKPWPSCRDTHLYIQAALELAAQSRIDVAHVASIVAPVGERNLIICEPAASKKAPTTAIDAKFSLYFTVATALAHKRVDLSSFTDEARGDRRVLDCAAKVSYRLDAQAARPLIDGGGAVLEVTMTDGTVHRQRVARLAGSIASPMSAAELVEKFIDCGRHAAAARSRDELQALAGQILSLETLAGVGEITRRLL